MIPRPRALAAAALAAMLLVNAAPALAGSGTPRAVDLGAKASSLAVSGDGSLVVVGTASDVQAFSPNGDAKWKASIVDARAVAVDQKGDVTVAGDGQGLVHFLRGDGAEFATAITTAAVTSVDITADGSAAAVGGSDGFVWFFTPGKALPPPLPAIPQTPVILYQWSFRAESGIIAVHVTADGEWINAGSKMLWALDKNGALLPALDTRLPCRFDDIGPKCPWVYEFAAGGQLAFLAGSRTTYDILAGWTNLPVQNEKATITTGTWEYFAGAVPSAGAFSGDAHRQLTGESLGRLGYYDDTPTGCCSKQAIWTYNMGSKVTFAALDGSGSSAAASAGSVVRAFGGATGALAWSYDAGAAIAGLAYAGSHLAGVAGNDALFWS